MLSRREYQPKISTEPPASPGFPNPTKTALCCFQGLPGAFYLRRTMRNNITVFMFLALMMLFIPSGCCYSDDDLRLAESIYRAEGGSGTKYPYGIKIIKCTGKSDCQRICLNSIRNSRKRFEAVGGNPKDTKVLIWFMAERYCPEGSDHWATMVESIYERLDDESGK